MKTIYIENYKGYKQGFIPLLDVNFFVGENSTGKSAILKLINLLHTKEFWFGENFSDENLDYGSFDEISNKNQSGDKYFKIGIDYSDVKIGINPLIRFILIKYESDEGMPSIRELNFLLDKKSVNVLIRSKTLECRIKDVDADISFYDWINSVKDFSEIDKVNDSGIRNIRLSILSVISIISNEILKLDRSPPLAGLFGREIYFFAPIRSKPKRIYETHKKNFSPEGDHLAYMLRKLSVAKGAEKIFEEINKYGKASSLFEEIEVKKLGNDDFAPIEIYFKYANTPIKITDVGYGISQVLPLILELLTNKRTTFLIQQPEVHLHPKAQAAFGDLLYNCHSADSKYILETHSEYMINRFRYNLYKNKNEKITSQILFFERDGCDTKTKQIKIEHNGNYGGDIPSSFKDFFITEELKMLEI